MILLCRTRQVPTPKQVAQALCRAGYQAFVEVENEYPTTSFTAEIRYAPDRMPVVVDCNNDLHDDPDEGDYEYWDWIKELVPDTKVQEGIRRFIFVRAMKNADAKAFQAVVDYIREATDALLAS